MAKKKKQLCIPQVVMDSFKEQIAKSYDASWKELIEEGYLSDEETKFIADDMWTQEPTDASDFVVGVFVCVPFSDLCDGGEVKATHNLELVKHVEYQQAEVNIYRKINEEEPAYFFYSGDDANQPALFKVD